MKNWPYPLSFKKSNPRIDMSADKATANEGDLITFRAKPFDISGAATQFVIKINGEVVATTTDFSAPIEFQTNQLAIGTHTANTEIHYFSSVTNQIEIKPSNNLTVTISAVQNALSFAPAWESRYTLNLDSDGWSITLPSSDSKLMYIDPDNGNDATAAPHTNLTIGGGTPDNPGSVSAYKTLPAALAETREGFPDYIYIKRGSVLTHNESLTFKTGRSLSERAVITSYGDVNDGLAVVDADLGQASGYMFNNSPANIKHWGMTHLKLTCSRRNPDSPNFYGWHETPVVNGILDLQDDTPSENILIEGCTFEYLSIAYYATTDLTSFPTPTNFIFRRNNIAKCWDSNPLLLTRTEGLIAENIFFRNGYWADYDNMMHSYGYTYYHTDFTLASPLDSDGVTDMLLNAPVPSTVSSKFGFKVTDDTGKTHDVTQEVVYDGTTTVRFKSAKFADKVCSAGNKVRLMVNRAWWEQVTVNSNVALNGSAVMQIPLKTSPKGDFRQGMTVTVAGQNGTLHETTLQSIVGSNLNISSTDFSIDPVNEGSMIVIHVQGPDIGRHCGGYYTKCSNLVIKDNATISGASIGFKLSAGGGDDELNMWSTAVINNLIMGGDVGISAGGNGSSDTIPRFDQNWIKNNWCIDIGRDAVRAALRYRGVGWGIEHKDNQNSVYTHNAMLSRELPSNNYALKIESLAHSDIVTDNISHGAGSISDSSGLNQDLLILGNPVNHASHSNWTTLPEFLVSIGESGDMEEFGELLIQRRKGNWLTYDRDYISALETSVGRNTPIILNQPNDIELSDGSTATFKFDAYMPHGTTYEWLDENDNVVATDVERELDIAVSDATSGNQYRLKATLPDESIIQSDLAMLTLVNRQYLTFAGAPYEVDFTFGEEDSITLTPGQSIEYTIITTANPNRMGLFANDTGQLRVHHRYGGIVVNDLTIGFTAIGAPSYRDGQPHTIKVTLPADGEMYIITVDGTDYPDIDNGAVTGDKTLTVNSISPFGSEPVEYAYTLYDVILRDTDDSVMYQFNLDSGAHSGATEVASTGNAMATMNISAGAWSS